MITDTKQLAKLLRLDLKDTPEIHDFSLKVPESFCKRMLPNDIYDPLLLQILPQKNELHEDPTFTTDPLTEKQTSPLPGLVHKYVDRALLLVTDVCALNCRFCFRRHLREKISFWPDVLQYLQNHPTISEVILSGGDPLMLPQNELTNIIEQLTTIPQLKRLRIHSRAPIAIPEQTKLTLPKTHPPIILVIHCNHPNEIDSSVVATLATLRQTGITIFNQSVLLRNINDSADTLSALSEKLFASGVLPYYLHILDKVKGATHFYVDQNRAKQIHLEMQTKLPGYLVPKLVVEVQNKKIYV